MKLLLTSGGLGNKSLVDALASLMDKPFSESKVLFVTTASQAEPGDKWWVIKDLNDIKECGFAQIDILDFNGVPEDIWRKRFEDVDVIYVEGGNTWHLMYSLKKSGLSNILPELLETRVWVGVSAGSIVTAKDLSFARMDTKKYSSEIEITNEDGLGWVDFYIMPHANSQYFKDATFENIENMAKNVQGTVYALDDNSAVKVDGENVAVVSEGEWRKFNG